MKHIDKFQIQCPLLKMVTSRSLDLHSKDLGVDPAFVTYNLCDLWQIT